MSWSTAVLFLLFFATAFTDRLIVPMLVSISHKLREVDWEQIRRLGNALAFVAILGVTIFLFKPNKKTGAEKESIAPPNES